MQLCIFIVNFRRPRGDAISAPEQTRTRVASNNFNQLHRFPLFPVYENGSRSGFSRRCVKKDSRSDIGTPLLTTL